MSDNVRFAENLLQGLLRMQRKTTCQIMLGLRRTKRINECKCLYFMIIIENLPLIKYI